MDQKYVTSGDARLPKVQKILRAVRRGAYVTFNLEILGDLSASPSALARETSTQRTSEWCRGVRGVIDIRTSTLCLFGAATAGTGFHVDSSQAINKAVAVAVSGHPCVIICMCSYVVCLLLWLACPGNNHCRCCTTYGRHMPGSATAALLAARWLLLRGQLQNASMQLWPP